MVEDDTRWAQSPAGSVAMAGRVPAEQGQGDMVWGHVALRDPDGRGLWMKAHLHGFGEVTTEGGLLIDWDGEVPQGGRRRHGDFRIHTEIIAARPDVNCTIHTHSMSACAFAATGNSCARSRATAASSSPQIYQDR